MRKLLLTALALSTFLAVAANGAARTDAVAQQATRYVVAFGQPNSLPPNADRLVADAGGTIVARSPQIGAVLAESANPAFAATLEGLSAVRAVDEDLFASIPEPEILSWDLGAEGHVDGGQESPPGPDPQPGTEPLYHQQWDKMRVNASATGSYAVQRGRRDVVVAVIDTGADVLPFAHGDLAPNLDFARSRSFVTSAGAALPDPNGDPNPASWDDKNGHGSWCLSAVGAPINAFGISGVAPNVTLVALKALGDTGSGSFFAVANALVYAGNNHFDVASMSLGGVIPHRDGGNAVWIVMQRAVEYARANGVLPVASAGNSNFDVNGNGGVVADFVRSPAGHAGVVGVAATGYYNQKAFYSNFGHGYIDVSAPGGSTRDHTGRPGTGVPVTSPYRGQGRVLGARSQEDMGLVPGPLTEVHCEPVLGGPCHKYAWVQGTSMAAPHAAGVSALIISQYGDFGTQNPQHPHMSPQQVEQIIAIAANNRPCPQPGTFTGGPGFTGADDACIGEAGYNNFFGKGIVDALKAVTVHGNR